MDSASVLRQAPPLRLSLGSKARLAAEILSTYARARGLVRRADLPRALSTLRRPVSAGHDLPLPDGARDGQRLGAAVVRTLEALPLDSRCLMRSLVLVALLARRGVHGSLVIAVRPSEAQLDAHAWVELEGRPLLAPADHEHGRLVTL